MLYIQKNCFQICVIQRLLIVCSCSVFNDVLQSVTVLTKFFIVKYGNNFLFMHVFLYLIQNGHVRNIKEGMPLFFSQQILILNLQIEN